jgi:hypothetical protein
MNASDSCKIQVGAHALGGIPDADQFQQFSGSVRDWFVQRGAHLPANYHPILYGLKR